MQHFFNVERLQKVRFVKSFTFALHILFGELLLSNCFFFQFNMAGNTVPSFPIILVRGMNTVPLNEVVCNIKLLDKTVSLGMVDVMCTRMVKVDGASQYRFYFCIWTDLNKPGDNDCKEKLNSSVALLKKEFQRYDGNKIDEVIKAANTQIGRYMMVSLFGEYKKKRGYVCVSSLLGIWSIAGLYISHIAITQDLFSKRNFGDKADGASFRKKGIAKLTVAVAQAVTRCIHQTDGIYLFSHNPAQDKGSFWETLGFKKANLEKESTWPDEITALISLYSFYSFEDLQSSPTLTPLYIAEPVKSYATYAVLKTRSILFEKPFFHWPKLNDGSLPSEQYSDHDLALFCLQDTLASKNTEVQVIPQRRKAGILLDVYRYKEYNTMFVKDCEEVNEELHEIITSDEIVPSVAINYALMAMMSAHENVYAISDETIDKWRRTTFQVAHSAYQAEFKDKCSEYDLIELEANNKHVKFIFPLFEPYHWLTVVRRWLNDNIHFFFADSADDTEDKYEDGKSKSIPLNVMWLFMDTPLWPIGVDAYWTRVPNIQQVEQECGARAFLHSFMLSNCATPHLSLLRLHKLEETVLSCLSHHCRQWVHDIIQEKRFVVPKAFQDIMQIKEKRYQYTTKWCNDNCILYFVEDRDQYDVTTAQVQLEDEEKLEKLYRGEQMKATKAQGRPLSSQNLEDCETTTAAGSVPKIQNSSEGLVSVQPATASENIMENNDNLAVSEENAKSGVPEGGNNESVNVAMEASIITVTQTQHDQLGSLEPPNNVEPGVDVPLDAPTGVPHPQLGHYVNSPGKQLIVMRGDDESDSGSSVDNGSTQLAKVTGKRLLFISDSSSQSSDEKSSSLMDIANTSMAAIQNPDNGEATQDLIDTTDESDSSTGSDGVIRPAPWARLSKNDKGITPINNKEISNQNNTAAPDNSNVRRIYFPITFYCSCCASELVKYITCSNCSRKMHKGCGIKVMGDDNVLQLFCKECSKGKPRHRQTVIDYQVQETYGLQLDQDMSRQKRRDSSIWLRETNEFNKWLSTVSHIKCENDKGRLRYYGKNAEGTVDEIYEGLLSKTLFRFYTSEFISIKLEKKKWHRLSTEVKKYINHHGRCYADNEIYSNFFKAENKEWQYIKFNTWNQRRPAPDDPAYELVDKKKDKGQKDTYWISFTNDKLKVEIQMVPFYFLRRWELFCDQEKLEGQPNEFTNVIHQARDFCNQWTEIPQGSYRRNFFEVEMDKRHLPKSFRVQQHGEHSCIFNSLANSLHYINDHKGRDEVLSKLEQSLQYAEFRNVSKTRKSFAAYVMNFCVKGYQTEILTKFDILSDRSMWPTLCVLKGSDGSTNHAVTVVEDFIFDSNNTYAMPLTAESLDWCCSGDEGEEVQFVGVHFAYRFKKHNPQPQLLLRQERKNQKALQAMIQSMLQLQDEVAVSLLQDYKYTLKPSDNVITLIREVLKSKALGYTPIRLKNIGHLMSWVAATKPTIFLLHATGTFNYAVFSSVGEVFFDGSRAGALDVNLQNFSNVVNMEKNEEGGKCHTIELLTGYVFLKRKYQVGAKKKSKSIM